MPSNGEKQSTRSEDERAAIELVEFLGSLGDEDQAERMARAVEPRALAAQFMFGICASGREAFITPGAGFEPESDDGGFLFWDVSSPIAHLLPEGATDTSGTGFWFFQNFASGGALGAFLLDQGFAWSIGVQKYFDEEHANEPGLDLMRALIEGRDISKNLPEEQVVPSASPRL